jgi:hypothetical protein
MSIAPPTELVEAAQRQLAAYLKLKPADVVLQSANAKEWPDGAIGCPKEGMAYPQVVTQGFLLVFTDPAQTASYEVHTAMTPAQMVLCQNGQPVGLSLPTGPVSAAPSPGAAVPAGEEASRVVDLAKAALAQELGVKAEDIALVAAEPTEWNDSSLGCPKPGQVYMQVITPGYRVTLEAQGQQYEYHTDTGKRAVRC